MGREVIHDHDGSVTRSMGMQRKLERQRLDLSIPFLLAASKV